MQYRLRVLSKTCIQAVNSNTSAIYAICIHGRIEHIAGCSDSADMYHSHINYRWLILQVESNQINLWATAYQLLCFLYPILDRLIGLKQMRVGGLLFAHWPLAELYIFKAELYFMLMAKQILPFLLSFNRFYLFVGGFLCANF